MSPRDLRIPQGTEAFYLEEAYAHRRLVRTFEDICASWAYSPAHTPVYDYYDSYRDLVDPSLASQSYRLVDRNGELLVMRSDITLFLARQMGLVLQRDDLPVRVAYADTILRHEDPHDLSHNEFFQVGAELIGASGPDADAESILLLLDLLDGWGATDVVIHIGHRALLGAPSRLSELPAAVAARMWGDVERHLRDQGVPESRSAELVRLFGFIGSESELSLLTRDLRHLSKDETRTIDELLELARVCGELGYSDRIRIDLSEVGSRHYHSGVVFQAYAPDASAAIASGGRYDGLLSHFGFDAPSVGFSVMLRRLQSRGTVTPVDRSPDVVAARGATVIERLRAARTLRQQGKVVSL